MSSGAKAIGNRDGESPSQDATDREVSAVNKNGAALEARRGDAVPTEAGANDDAREGRASDASDPDLLNDRGIELVKRGKLDEGIACYEQALRFRPEFPEACNNLGIALSRQAKLEQAIGCYERALRLKPDYPQAHNNLGIARSRRGMAADAMNHFKEALRLKPNYPEAHNNLGNLLRSGGRIDEALEHYGEALRLKPNYPEALNNQGIALAHRNRLDEATACYHKALRIKPNYAEAYNNLGNLLAKEGKHDSAIAHFERAIQLRPAYAEACNNLGNTLAECGDLDEAAEQYRKALASKADYAEAENNLGIVLGKLGRRDEALRCYERALRLKPDYADAHLNQAMALLAMGDFTRGWPEYEWRLKCGGRTDRAFATGLWSGEPLDGRTILLYAEQGLGDTLQFIRYADQVCARGGKVIVECQPALVPLLARGRDGCRVIAFGDPIPQFDLHAPLLSLPRIFETTRETIPAGAPYVFADPALVEDWKLELADIGPFRVGINWQGNPTFQGDRHRSIPLVDFEPLAELPGVRLVSLQKHVGTEQIAQVAGRFPVLDFGRRLDEVSRPFLDTAAIMMNLDLVVTSDTSIAHLAGALGVPVWLALPRTCDWRWGDSGELNPWYPTMRIFRQTKLGRWDDVFHRIASSLAAKRWLPVRRPPILIEVTAGELFDRIAQLEIKSERSRDESERRYWADMLNSLRSSNVESLPDSETMAALAADLTSAIRQLADIDEELRARVEAGDVGSKIAWLVKAIVGLHDLRDELKRRIEEGQPAHELGTAETGQDPV